jgi:hypothetical protein
MYTSASTGPFVREHARCRGAEPSLLYSVGGGGCRGDYRPRPGAGGSAPEDFPMPEKTEPEQITIMKRLVEMSAERSYMNAERTLAVWVRTALALMIFGIAVDRFGLL